ncbi:hypothetical protein X425_01450 [Mycobacterium avium XTB13-223]|jgi:CubicO group peptidase (beta-lactamase class C family)|nr:hypothetical protein X425_01450 [Mycobacterium avium XTB13-223]
MARRYQVTDTLRQDAYRFVRRAMRSSLDAALSGGGQLPVAVRGAAETHFAGAVRFFAGLFPGRHLGGGALAVYQNGRPMVDVWTGWSDRNGQVPWTADTGAMVFSATKGAASTVIHCLVDRGLLDYDQPVARYWPQFGANGKSAITVRDLMGHLAGLSQLNGITRSELLDHRLMEDRLAAAPPGRLLGKSAYHALTYGWLVSGLARSVTGQDMRELFRSELAAPLDTEGIHLGRPPEQSPIRAAQLVMPQAASSNDFIDSVAPRLASHSLSGGLGALYVPGIKTLLQGDMPFLDSQIPAAKGVMTARALAKLYSALANGGRIDDTQFLSRSLVAGLTGERSQQRDRIALVPMSFHLGYHGSPIPAIMTGFGHAGVGGSIGWADPGTGTAFGFVHNRLLLLTDYAAIAVLATLLDRAAKTSRKSQIKTVRGFGSPYRHPGHPARIVNRTE